MGLFVSSLGELPQAERSLYIYLLDYGWPAGDYERLFRDNFGHLSQRASETGSVVIMSGRGVHFANEVLSWHSVCGHDSTELLPAILITHTHPSYFAGSDGQASDDEFSFPFEGDSEKSLGDIALLPLKTLCRSPSEFLDVIASIFDDLERGLTLRNFRAAEFDVIKPPKDSWPKSAAGRVGRAIMLQPNVGGVGIDLKKLFEPTKSRSPVEK